VFSSRGPGGCCCGGGSDPYRYCDGLFGGCTRLPPALTVTILDRFDLRVLATANMPRIDEPGYLVGPFAPPIASSYAYHYISDCFSYPDPRIPDAGYVIGRFFLGLGPRYCVMALGGLINERVQQSEIVWCNSAYAPYTGILGPGHAMRLSPEAPGPFTFLTESCDPFYSGLKHWPLVFNPISFTITE